MTKKIIGSAIAALALAALPGVAHADATAGGSFTGLGGAFGIGTAWGYLGGSLGNTETASPTLATAFTLTGEVSRDCSFYAGSAEGRTINFGTIGVRTGSGENVNDAFDMRAAADVAITTGTAGCNTKNEVRISKQNGTDGLRNNAAATGGYDSDEFTNKLPYRVDAAWTGVEVGQVGAGTIKTLSVDTNEAADSKAGGAWRSGFVMNVLIPTPAKGLVAGTYSDVLTVTLSAI
ncbi:hypothetical protein [Sphingomonas sp. LaA6.9]|uniref:hypothetical protein n=1 Tax=Sphingomonas sp. LaA6.9 TaxID=2919914 RepID=UPI001F4FE5FE|nr:hypothetical protein [Sphingomonas sp. LaA6.9]MCJ8158071.1 hypothetical protein [Sphingomonas sp. LaA6.9]